MAQLTYNPAIFSVPDEKAARAIILTPDGDRGTDERWERETPYLTDLLGPLVYAAPGRLIVDFGCGIGRMSRALIASHHCQVLGVDISQEMRSLAPGYVQSPNFSVVSRDVFAGLVARGLRVDGAISVWVLQHVLSAEAEVGLLAEALRPGARLAVVNANHRIVPTVERKWTVDGVDVRHVLAQALTPARDGKLDAAHVGQNVADYCFWAAYDKA